MKYSKETREKALKLSNEIGVKRAAEQLGIEYSTLSSWRCKRNASLGNNTEKSLIQRNIELEREIDSLRRANEMLKNALSYFTKEPIE